MSIAFLYSMSVYCFFSSGQAVDFPTCLENEYLRVRWNDQGDLIEIEDKEKNIALRSPADVALQGFSLVLQDGDTRTEVSCNDQEKPKFIFKGNACRVVWREPLRSSVGEVFRLSLEMRYELLGDRLVITGKLSNKSSASVVEVRYSQIGGLTQLRALPDGEPATIGPPFDGKRLALPFETTVLGYPGHLSMGFLSVANERLGRGLYVGAYDQVARYKQWHFETVKGTSAEDIAVKLVFLPFVGSGATWSGCDWAVAFHDGDWVEAGQIYREWFLETFGLRDAEKDWIRRENCFQMVMMMLPEGNINFRFRDVPELARQGMQYGIDSLQLAGWQLGGHDNGYPFYEPDPRLGTWDDVAWAINECHKMGVRVYFFANLHWAMNDLRWFERELHEYVSLNALGKTNWIGYWGMGTIASRMGYTPPTMSLLDVNFPGIADPTVTYFRKLAEVGADGIHIDKLMPAALEYNPRVAELGMSRDTAGLQGTINLMDRIIRECTAVKPDFALSCEAFWDRVFSYGRATWWVGYMPLTRWVFPENAETKGQYWPYDFFGVNDAVRDGSILMLSPHKFNYGIGYPVWRRMAAYVGEANRIRNVYGNYIFFGRKCSPNTIRLKSTKLPSSLQYAVWADLDSNRRAAVFTNTHREDIAVEIEGFRGSVAKACRVVRPFREERVFSLPATVKIPGEQYAVIIEETEESSVVADDEAGQPACAPISEKEGITFDFESGDFKGWQADGNWTVDDNTAGNWYTGWQGRFFAWSGKGGEAATGKLRSMPFVLDKDGVEVLIAGWADIKGRSANRWNYVTLNLENGKELDRVYAPNTTTFSPMILDGSGYRGQRVFLEAVDDAPEGSYSMLCIDSIRTVEIPTGPSFPVLEPKDYIQIENDNLLVAVRKTNGAIARIFDKQGKSDLILEPRLADNFAFTLPIVGKEAWTNTEANQIRGTSQRLTSYAIQGDTLTLQWEGPLVSVFGVYYDVSAEMKIVLEWSQITFTLKIDNRTDLEIGEVCYPIIGGTKGLGSNELQRKATLRIVPVGSGMDVQPIYRVFNNMTWLGEPLPEQLYVYPHTLSTPWMYLYLYNPKNKRGVYFAAHDPIRRVKAVQLQQYPGLASYRVDGNWPRPEELEGMPSGVSVNFVHLVYHPPKQEFVTSPVVLRFQSGDAEEAKRTYLSWFESVFGKAANPHTVKKLKRVGRIPFAEIANLVESCKAEGVDAICLDDWKIGGQHNGVPTFTPAPELGGAEGLREAGKACHAAGARLYLRFNVQFCNPDSELFKSFLAPYCSRDRWGVPFTRPGDRWVFLNLAVPEVRDFLVGQVGVLAQAEVDGLYVVDFFNDKLDFNHFSGMTPDRSDWDGGLQTLENLLHVARQVNPDFSLLTEMFRDHLTLLAEVPESQGIP